jgi:arylsulfatase A-like enzyme
MHIILYVLDALRADHLGCYGYERETSPHIDALAREGVVFENCFTSTTWTRPVAASLLTGTYPEVHLTRSRSSRFSTNLTRLPEVLRTAGFKTAAFSTMGNIASDMGFERGFDRYLDLFREPDILAKRRRLDAVEEALMHNVEDEIALPRAEDVNDYLFPWLDENQGSNTFNFIWSIETHEPFGTPAEFRHFSSTSPSRPNEGDRRDICSAGAADRQRLIDLYDDEIIYNDHCLGRIVSHLKALDIYDDTLFIVIGDHGEAFYEHGVYSHGHTPYEEVIRVPMIMKFPSGQYAGIRVTGLTELIDIFSTTTAVVGPALGTADSTFVQGYNLLPLVEGRCNQVRDYAFSDTQALEIHNRYLSVRDQRWKYIEVQRPERNVNTLSSTIQHMIERRLIFKILGSPRHFVRNYFKRSDQFLFDLGDDPGEQHNLAATRPDLVGKFRQVLTEWRQQNEALAEQVGSMPLSYEENESLRRHLEELGYV